MAKRNPTTLFLKVLTKQTVVVKALRPGSSPKRRVRGAEIKHPVGDGGPYVLGQVLHSVLHYRKRKR